MRKGIFIVLGTLSVILGIIGIFIPGLPTTPFLLLSSWLFYKSSRRLHDYLHRSRWLGPYIRHYESKQGVSWRSKLLSLACMWTMICISAFCFIESLHVRLLLLILGIVGTCSIIFLVPAAQKNRETK